MKDYGKEIDMLIKTHCAPNQRNGVCKPDDTGDCANRDACPVYRRFVEINKESGVEA